MGRAAQAEEQYRRSWLRGRRMSSCSKRASYYGRNGQSAKAEPLLRKILEEKTASETARAVGAATWP
jgi:hypothetical protein